MLLLLVFLSHFILSAQVKYENDSIIIWNKQRKINWDDFKSETKSDVLTYQEALAYISLSIKFYPKEISCETLANVKIVAVMNKMKSWVGVKTEDKDGGLNHEQTHFNIAELYARKIRKEISDYLIDNKCNMQNVAEIYHKLSREHLKVQYLYDKEVRMCDDESVILCFNLEKQKEWDFKIAKELEELKDYELLIISTKED
ncbi:MAG: hypothetical protein ACOVLC_02680 [Flavobacterium sp.]